MNTRSEIEEYLENIGIKIESHFEDRESTEYGQEPITTERYMPITGEKIVEDNLKRSKIKVLNKEATNALLDLISQSIINGDMETAKTALEVLQSESGFYKGHRNAAIRNDIPLDKRIEFEQYCQPQRKEFTGPMAAFMASAHNVAIGRRVEQVNNVTSEIKRDILEKEKDKKEEDKEI